MYKLHRLCAQQGYHICEDTVPSVHIIESCTFWQLAIALRKGVQVPFTIRFTFGSPHGIDQDGDRAEFVKVGCFCTDLITASQGLGSQPDSPLTGLWALH